LNSIFSYVSSKLGTVFEINYELIVVHKVRRLLPTGSRQDIVEVGSEFGIGINCLSVNEAFCVTGSDDGYLRLWPLDFSGVVLEAGKFTLSLISRPGFGGNIGGGGKYFGEVQQSSSRPPWKVRA
jgi:hypothetical protein